LGIFGVAAVVFLGAVPEPGSGAGGQGFPVYGKRLRFHNGGCVLYLNKYGYPALTTSYFILHVFKG